MKLLPLVILGLLLLLPTVTAVDMNYTVTPEEQAHFEGIMHPIMKIYAFFKYAASIIAVVVLLFAAFKMILSGGDQAKRESAKQTIFWTILGLILIWVAPIIVTFLVG